MNSTNNNNEALLFDIETLLNVAQANKILWLSNSNPDSIESYRQQKSVIGQKVNIDEFKPIDKDKLLTIDQHYDMAIVYDFVEHLNKTEAIQILARLRDFLCPQFCVALTLDDENWQLTDLLALGLRKVSSYPNSNNELALFKYSISNYKNVPDWLNADNWANPKMWGKYWW